MRHDRAFCSFEEAWRVPRTRIHQRLFAGRLGVSAPTIYQDIFFLNGRDTQLSLCTNPLGGSIVSPERRDRRTDALWGVPDD